MPQCTLLIFFTCLTPDDLLVNGEALQLNGLRMMDQSYVLLNYIFWQDPCQETNMILKTWTLMMMRVMMKILMIGTGRNKVEVEIEYIFETRHAHHILF